MCASITHEIDTAMAIEPSAPEHSPHQFDGGYVYEDAVAAQKAALDDIERYPVKVESRVFHNDVGETPYARFSQERVRFSDGAVRLLTRAQVKKRYFGKDNVSPYAISDGDPLFTGPNGLNEDFIDAFAQEGFDVEWLHHQGRHALLPTSPRRVRTMLGFLSNKSVLRSAYQEHALFDHLGSTTGTRHDTSRPLRAGFSRSAMSGEAFVAIGPLFDRSIEYSDLLAKCFAVDPGIIGTISTFAKQAKAEGNGLLVLSTEAIGRQRSGEKGAVRKLAGTLDLHPLNLAHEIAWIPKLVRGANGEHSRAISLGTTGVRSFLDLDEMSQFAEQQLVHAAHPNLALILEVGAHVEGGRLVMIQKQAARFGRVRAYMLAHGMSLSGMQPSDYLPAGQTYWTAGTEYAVAV